MSESTYHSHQHFDSLSLEVLKQIDMACRAYERTIQTNARLSLDEFALQYCGLPQPALRRELLRIDLEYRLGRAEPPARSDYMPGTPKSIVDQVFDEFASRLESDTRFQQPSTHRVPSGSTSSSTGPEVGNTIGPYQLIRLLGEGGMGSVWLAEQTRPIRRRVAVKLIRSILADDETIARFELEQQALALMTHENIARVLDAGTSTEGRPYFVMELVTGAPITRLCDDMKLSIRDRVALLLPVCDAIQHAHQRGIIHRDVKPSNVFIEMVDGKPVPKVIDFGLAKALDPQRTLSPDRVETEAGVLMGTVQYMSPEQADLDQLDIDTRTDIYSIGVILFELLTGDTPVRRGAVGKNIWNALDQVREIDPPRPSDRIHSTDSDLDTIAEQRLINPSQLRKLLEGELDWIVLKALEKDRNRRYQSASELAADLTRFLNDEAVVARPPSVRYRIRKAVRKNRLLFASGTLVAVVVLLSVLFLSYFAGQLHLKNQSLEQALSQRNTAVQELQKETDSTASILDTVLNGNTQFMEKVTDHPLLKQSRLSSVRREILSQAYDQFQTIVKVLEQEQRTDQEHLIRLADAYADVGLTASEMRIYDESELAYRRAYELRLECHEDPETDTLQNRIHLSSILSNIAKAQYLSGDLATGISNARSSLSLIEDAVSDHPSSNKARDQLVLAQVTLGTLLMAGPEKAAAEEHLRSAVTHTENILEDAENDGGLSAQPKMFMTLVQSISHLGNYYSDSMRYEDSVNLYRRAVDLAEAVAAQNSTEPLFKLMLSQMCLNDGTLHHRIAKTAPSSVSTMFPQQLIDRAREQYNRSGSVLEELIEADPHDPEYKQDLASVYNRRGVLAIDTGDLPEAKHQFERAVELISSIVGAWPANSSFISSKAQILGNQTAYFNGIQDYPAAYAVMLQVVELFEGLIAIDDQVMRNRINVAGAYGNLGTLSKALGDFEQAADWLEKSVQLAAELNEQIPDHPQIREFLSQGHEAIAVTEMRLGHYERALHSCDNAIATALPRNLNKYRALRLGALADLDRIDDAMAYLEAMDVGSFSADARLSISYSLSRLVLKLESGTDPRAAEMISLGIESLQRARVARLVAPLKELLESEDLKGLVQSDEFRRLVGVPLPCLLQGR